MQLHVFYQLRYFVYKCPTITWWMFRFCLGKKEWNFPGNAFLALFCECMPTSFICGLQWLWWTQVLCDAQVTRPKRRSFTFLGLVLLMPGVWVFFFSVESSLKVKRIQVVLFHASVSLRTSLIVQACFTPQVQVVWSAVCQLHVFRLAYIFRRLYERPFFLSLSPPIWTVGFCSVISDIFNHALFTKRRVVDGVECFMHVESVLQFCRPSS